MLGLLRAAPARADDWLAALPPCSSARARPELPPRFELVYPRGGLPALVAAGDRLVARVYVPSPLTPPPGVQQPRALAGWGAELIGHAALAVAQDGDAPTQSVHRYRLEVFDVRPDAASTLLYRAAIAIPAWAAPGTYDLELRAPGGSQRALSAVRVLAAGATPRVAWLDTPERLADPSTAALPVDVWVHVSRPASATGSDSESESESGSESGPESGSDSDSSPGIRLPPAPRLDLRVPALALRIGRALLVIGACPSQQPAFADEVGSVLAREARTRMDLPAPAPAGSRQVWGQPARAWPARGSLRMQRGEGSLDVGVAAAFGDTAELVVLIASDPAQPVRVSGAATAPAFYPASDIGAREVPARALYLRVAAGGRARIEPAPGRVAPLAYEFRAAPQPARSGALVRLAVVPQTGASAMGGLRVAWRPDALRTAFGPAQIEHRFLPLGAARVQALALAADGRAQRVSGEVRVRTARASGCSVAPGARRALPAGLWPALLLVQRRGRRKSRGAPCSGIDCGSTPVCRELTVTDRTYLISALFLLIAAGCGHQNIPNTHVEDTAENREIIEFVERYRKAVEDRDIATLLNMTSRFYFDDMGTPAGEDDIDFDTLKLALERMRKDVLAARYQISYRGLTYTTHDRVLVDLLYTGWFKVDTAEGPQWRRRLEPHRIVLAREDGKLLIVSGM